MHSYMPDSNIPVNTNYSQSGLGFSHLICSIARMKNLKDMRKAKKLSQVELAEIVGCTQGMISKIEQGNANPTLDLIDALATALGTTPVTLFGLPEIQQRALLAIDEMDDNLRESAIIVLEKMAAK